MNIHGRKTAVWLVCLGILCMFSTLGQEVREEEVTDIISPADEERLRNLNDQHDGSEKKTYLINKVSATELASLSILTPIQIIQFIKFREAFGQFISFMELQAIPYWTIETARSILPYLRIVEKGTESLGRSKWYKDESQRLLYRTGSTSGRKMDFLTYKQLFSYRANHQEKIFWGATTEKDPGDSNLFDHVSGYAGIKKIHYINTLIMGDFTAAMGQGLIHWQGYAQGRSGNILQGCRQSPLFKPHTGTEENNFHRGFAAEFKIGKWQFAMFVSKKKLALATQVLSQLTMGGRLSRSSEKGTTNINMIYHQFDSPIEKQERVYNYHALRDKSSYNLSLDHAWVTKAGLFFGEYALDKNLKTAIITGFMKSLHPKLDLSIVIRNISSTYRAFSSNVNTQNEQANNERGIFGCINFQPSISHRFEYFFDRYLNPWPVYGCDRPRKGQMVSLQYLCRPSKKIEMSLRYTQSRTDANLILNTEKTASIIQAAQKRFRMHLSAIISKSITFRYRTEIVEMHKDNARKQNGWLAYAELIVAPPLGRVSMSARTSLFDTDGYDTRIYSYERDLSFYHSIPAIYGRGTSQYLLLNLKISNNLQWSVKGMWVFKNKERNYLGEPGVDKLFQWRSQMIWYPWKA